MSEKERKKSHFTSGDDLRNEEIKEIPEYCQAINELSAIEKVYESISILITQNGSMHFIIKDNEQHIMQTQLIDSSVMTFKNITSCLENGSFSDAYTLLRKVRDESIMFLYFWILIESYGRNDDQQDLEEVNIEIKNFIGWQNNDIRSPDTHHMLNVIKKNKDIENIITEYNLENNWKSLTDKLNNFVHINGRDFATANFSHLIDFQQYFKSITEDAKYIAVVFIFLFLLVDSTIVSATDYVDYLEMNATPPEGSQYEVAPGIQDFITNYLREHNNELVDFIRKSSVMNIK